MGIFNVLVVVFRKEIIWEFGYKGLIVNKLVVFLDIYNCEIDGVMLFIVISFFYGLLGLD